MTLDELRQSERPLVSVRQTAEVLGLPLSTCYDAIRKGLFPVQVIKVGNRSWVRRSELLGLLDG